MDCVNQTKEQIRHDEEIRKLRARVPVVCPDCKGECYLTDAALFMKGEPCTIECPTCAPFGGRGAIWEEGERE